MQRAFVLLWRSHAARVEQPQRRRDGPLQSGEDSGPGSGLAGWRHSPAPADCGPLGGFHTGQPSGLFQGAAARFMGLFEIRFSFGAFAGNLEQLSPTAIDKDVAASLVFHVDQRR